MVIGEQKIQTNAIALRDILLQKGWYLTTAESCTGGEMAARLTDLAGSSRWFERGFVTYANAAKEEMLGVSPNTLTQYGAVSEETAREMANGSLTHSPAHCAIAVTGIAVPDGGSTEKPVGTVYLGFASIDKPCVVIHRFFAGDRIAIRQQTVITALEEMVYFLE